MSFLPIQIMGDLFKRKGNSFLLETISPNYNSIHAFRPDYIRCFPEPLTNNLSTISALYIYTGTPPHGYGTQAPKVAETVSRSEEYNRKTEERSITVGGTPISMLNWLPEKDGDFPHDKVHGNYITSVFREMCSEFVNSNYPQLDSTMDKIMKEIEQMNSDVLTKGRQTFCPIKSQSVTASQAYETAMEFLEENTGENIHTLLDWIRAIMVCFEKRELRIKELVEVKQTCTTFDPETKQKVKYEKSTYVLKSRIVSGEEVKTVMKNYCCRFASYIKHKERGKKDRRAIASATMFLRPFLFIIEYYHLELAKRLPGSTISIGGEEKKAKITNNLEESSLSSGPAQCASQGTEDATKWNECLSPAIFALMHHYFFDNHVRMYGMQVPPRSAELFLKIAWIGHLFQAWKQIQLGPGVMIESEKFYRRLTWTDENALLMNTRTKDWYLKVRHLITPDRKFLYSSGGMLMGMLNAASTTVGLIPANFRMNPSHMKVITMRSSDDSTTKYLSDSSESNAMCVALNKQNLSLIGINMSPDKTFFYSEGYAEYTSWYIDNRFVSQYGTDVPSIRPQGKNPADDLFSIAKSTATSLQTLSINHLGASVRLRLGLSAVKRLWRLPQYGSNPRPGVKLDVQLVEDGGLSLWNCVNCHLNEVCMKETKITTDEEKKYIERIINPENPFSEKVEEEISYSKEQGCLVSEKVVTPRTVFHFVKRSNRTFKGKSKEVQADKEKAYGAVISLLELADPTISLSYPNSSISIRNHLISLIQSQKEKFRLSEEEESMVSEAMSILETGKTLSSQKPKVEFDDMDFDME